MAYIVEEMQANLTTAEYNEKAMREVFGYSSDEDFAEEGDGSSNDEEDTNNAVYALGTDYIRGAAVNVSSPHSGIYDIQPYLNNPNMKFFLASLTAASAKVYQDRYEDFFRFWNTSPHSNLDMNHALLQYFSFKRDERKDGVPRYAGSVFNGWYAMFQKFYQMCNLGNLLTELPVLALSCKKWKKQHRTKKAATFSKGVFVCVYKKKCFSVSDSRFINYFHRQFEDLF